MGKSDLLLVGQTPPPYHGQAVVTAMLYEHDWEGMKVEKIRMGFSDELSSVGKASFGKVFHLISIILKTWYVALRKSPKTLYYLPASPNLTPVLRDVIYLGAVRWMFSNIVFHYHAGGLDQYIESKPVLKQLAKWVYGKADVSIDVNETKPATGEYFRAQSNIVVMNGLDVEPQELVKTDGCFTVLSVGLICEEKGILELVRTAGILREKGVKCVWNVVGSWESESFKDEVILLIEDLGVKDIIRFKGVLKGEAKWKAYASADAFAFLSHHPTETFGLVLIEAMGMGLPVVTTKWRSIPNVVKNSRASILCDVKSPDQFANAFIEMISDQKKRIEMGKHAKSHYQQNFTRHKFIQKMENVFSDLLDK